MLVLHKIYRLKQKNYTLVIGRIALTENTSRLPYVGQFFASDALSLMVRWMIGSAS
jgi:hypothetical protein